MNRILFLFILIGVFSNKSFSQDKETLITINDTKISKGEFERIYKKNNSNLYNESEIKTPEEYLDLFVDFKLKVLEAERLKMDTSSVFVNELAGYREELAAPYLTDVKYNEQMVYDLYNRTTKEVNASHLLLLVPKDATHDKEDSVLTRILEIRKEIINGKDFNEAAFEYSQDPSAKSNRGNLGYFTAFQMVVPFENAAFTTPVGEVSQPIRTSFGYHLIKVHDIRKNQGEILVAHIMKMFPQDMTNDVKKQLKTEIDSIYAQLQKGADFAELARTKSDDKRSAVEGGQMPWFSAGRMIPEFSEPAFALKNIGDYSKPVETPYGYHIIKKLDVRPVPSFAESKENLENKIKQDPARSITSKQAFIDKLKTEYNFRENAAGKNIIIDKNITDSIESPNFELFTIDNKSYSFNQFRDYLKTVNATEGAFMNQYDNWIDYEITKLEDSKLEDKYPEFRYLVQEYHDGILLFNISEEKIWNFAAKDSVGLDEYYNNNKDKYFWEERFKGMIVTCKDSVTREEADKYFAANMPVDEITELLNKNGNMISITEGAWEKGANPVVDYYVWNGPEPKNFDSELTFIRGDKISPEPKTLNEAKGMYVSDYQKYLEEKWIKDLRASYKIKVDKKLLKTINGV